MTLPVVSQLSFAVLRPRPDTDDGGRVRLDHASARGRRRSRWSWRPSSTARRQPIAESLGVRAGLGAGAAVEGRTAEVDAREESVLVHDDHARRDHRAQEAAGRWHVAREECLLVRRVLSAELAWRVL